MPTAESEFGIKITSRSDGSAIHEAAKGMSELKDKAEGAEINMRALHTALSAINPEFGEIAHIGHLVEFGAGYAIALAFGKALQEIREYYQAIREQMEKNIETSREYSQRLEEVAEKSKAAAEIAAAAWDREREAAKRMHDQTAHEMELMLRLREVDAAASVSQAEAVERHTRAEIALAQAQGRITATEGKRMEDEAAQRKADAEQEQKEQTEQFKVEAELERKRSEAAHYATAGGGAKQLKA